MSDVLFAIYPWVKALHVAAILSWMAGLFYLPRLFVHHAEQAPVGSESDPIFRMMEAKLFRVIMRPAMIVAWICGIVMAATPGVLDWGAAWVWVKLAAVLGMTGFHMWCGARLQEFSEGRNRLPGRRYRLMNEVPTVLMLIIVVSVIVRPF